MTGNQFGFNYSTKLELPSLFNDIKVRLEDYFGHYNLTDEDIVYIQVSFRLLDKMLYSGLFLDSEESNSPTSRSTLNMISMPTSTNEVDLGKPLPVITDNNKIKEVTVSIKGVICNFMVNILEKAKLIRNKHEDNITEFDSSCKFYYIKSSIDYILVIKELGCNKVEKLKYSLSGILISKIIDTIDNNR